MKLFAAAGLMALTLVGCGSAPTQQDNYMDTSLACLVNFLQFLWFIPKLKSTQ
jgi:hypothetical protein